MTTLTYVPGSDSIPVVNVRDSLGKEVDLRTSTRWLAVFYGTDTANNFTVDTDITAAAITADIDGDISFNLADTSINEDNYVVNLVVYDAGHPEGQQIADECCGPYLCLNACGTHLESG